MTLSDVARVVGVSAITVSRALRVPGRVSPELRNRILETVEQMGYVPDLAARALASRDSGVIGLIMPTLTHVPLLDIMTGIEDRLCGSGFGIQYANTRFDQATMEQKVRMLLAQRPSGLIFVGVAPAGESPNSSTVGRYGGNMDCRDVIAGASLFVTAQVDGGLLYAGDLHAVQGDGECSLTAVEMEGAVELSVRVVRPGPVRGPVVFAEGRMVVIGDGETLDEAATLALDETMAILRADRGWTRERTAMLLSAAADVSVTQLVNARKGVKVTLDERYLLTCPFERKED